MHPEEEAVRSQFINFGESWLHGVCWLSGTARRGYRKVN